MTETSIENRGLKKVFSQKLLSTYTMSGALIAHTLRATFVLDLVVRMEPTRQMSSAAGLQIIRSALSGVHFDISVVGKDGHGFKSQSSTISEFIH